MNGRRIFMLVDEFPVSSGIYVLRNGEEVLYVGKTNNFHRRMKTHHKLHDIIPYYPNATVELIDYPVDELSFVEMEYIKKLNPLFNENTWGVCRKSVSDLVKEFWGYAKETYNHMRYKIGMIQKSTTYAINQRNGLHTKVGKARRQQRQERTTA